MIHGVYDISAAPTYPQGTARSRSTSFTGNLSGREKQKYNDISLKSHQAAAQEQSTTRIFAHYSSCKMDKSARREMSRLRVV